MPDENAPRATLPMRAMLYDTPSACREDRG